MEAHPLREECARTTKLVPCLPSKNYHASAIALNAPHVPLVLPYQSQPLAR